MIGRYNMEKEINFGIGLVTGRANVCDIVNNYYKDMLEQVGRFSEKVKITIFILFDSSYQQTPREEFYNIKAPVYENIKIKYITPEDIKEQIKKLSARKEIKNEDVEFFLGHGHAKGRNTIMYYAIKYKMDYLLFWDDDEYPVAVLKENGKNVWLKQDNILKHLEFMKKENADVTIGYHCGYISPIPYIDYTEKFTEKDMKEKEEVAKQLRRFMRKHHLPFLATDRSVLNLPAIGKSMTFQLVGLTEEGKRILCFEHDGTRRHSPIIDRMGQIYIVENKSLAAYLRQLAKMGEDPEDYASIWNYTKGETETRFSLYEYPDFPFHITDKMSNLSIED